MLSQILFSEGDWDQLGDRHGTAANANLSSIKCYQNVTLDFEPDIYNFHEQHA